MEKNIFSNEILLKGLSIYFTERKKPLKSGGRFVSKLVRPTH